VQADVGWGSRATVHRLRSRLQRRERDGHVYEGAAELDGTGGFWKISRYARSTSLIRANSDPCIYSLGRSLGAKHDLHRLALGHSQANQ